MASLAQFKDWFHKKQDKIRQDLFTFLRFRSVSTDPAYKKEVLACAEWLKSYFVQGGIAAELIPTTSYPIVFAEVKSTNPHAKTVLIYGHYDVQPIDPLEEWKTDPFEPTEIGGKIYARGASDDKGQIFYAVLAAICLKEMGDLPVNIKFCIEGEEECHSQGLTRALPKIKARLKADALLIVDFDMLEGTPSITLGSRGTSALEVTLRGSSTDLHSGVLGGIAYNPNRALAELLAKLWDEKGRVAVPGFYDDIEKEDASAYLYPYDKGHFQKNFGIEAFGGEVGKNLKEANWLEPTLDINGMVGGYTGEGMKTVIPACALAKLSVRTVPHQNPDKVLRAIQDFLQKNAPKGMDVKVELFGGTGAWRGNPHNWMVAALEKGLEEVTGKKCAKILSGASIPIVTDLRAAVGGDPIGMGFALSTDKIHAPNEHFDFGRFESGFLSLGLSLANLGTKT